MSGFRSAFFYRNKPRLLLAGVFFLIGAILLSCFGPVKLSCNRVNPNQVNCLLSRSVAFGLIQTEAIAIQSLKQAKLDQRIKRAVEVSGGAPYGWPYENETPVYNVVLVGHNRILFDGYSYSYNHNQRIADRINAFLGNPNASSLDFQLRNHWLDVMTGITLGLSVALLCSAR